MSVILICRKLLNGSIKPKIFDKMAYFKMHTMNCQKTPILSKSSASVVTKRTFFKFFKKPKKEELYIIDNISEHYKLIYRTTMERYILYTQLGTSITAVIVVLAVIYNYGSPKGQLQFYGGQEHTPRSTDNELHLYVTIFFTVVVLLQVLITRTPLRIYYLSAQKKYIMILPANVPFDTTQLTYKLGEVEKLPLSGILPWKDARFKVKGEKNVIIVEDHFRKPADLWIMLGIQRDPEDDDQ